MGTPNQVDLKDATIKLKDGTTPTANEITLKIGEGNLTWTETYNREYMKDRGILDSVRDGDEEPCEVSFQIKYAAIKASTGDAITPAEFLKNTNAETTLVSTGSGCDPYACDIEVFLDYSSCTAIQDETLTFSEFRVESLGGDIQAGQLSVSGKCNAQAPTAVRTDSP